MARRAPSSHRLHDVTLPDDAGCLYIRLDHLAMDTLEPALH